MDDANKHTLTVEWIRENYSQFADWEYLQVLLDRIDELEGNPDENDTVLGIPLFNIQAVRKDLKFRLQIELSKGSTMTFDLRDKQLPNDKEYPPIKVMYIVARRLINEALGV